MKLSVIEPPRSKDINSNLARWLIVERQAVFKALDNSLKTFNRGSNNVREPSNINFNRLTNSSLQPANLSLAETIAAPPKIFEFEPDLSAENCQLEDIQASKQPVWFKILVIENDDLSRDRLSNMLRGKDTQVIEAKESKVGIELAKSLLPDLIICELMMPGIDGYGVKYFLQNYSHTYKIPLLFITTHTKQRDLNSETILLANNNKVEPVNKARLCDAIADKLIQSTQA